MNKLKVALFLFYFTFIVNNSFSQFNHVITPKHSHPEYEKELQEMKTVKDNADKTYQLAQNNYNAIKEYDINMDKREKCFLTFLGILISFFSLLGVGSYIYNFFLNAKSRSEIKDKIDEKKAEVLEDMNNNFENLKKENLGSLTVEVNRIITANKKTVEKIFTAKEKDYYLRENAKILVVYDEKTKPTIGFKKVLSIFDNHEYEKDTVKLAKLSTILNKKNIERLKNADLVILENNDVNGKWNILLGKVPSPEENNEVSSNKETMVMLANKICERTSLIYYGQGIFPVEKVDADKQHLIAFANSPSTLYSNIMNMLKFQDVLKEE